MEKINFKINLYIVFLCLLSSSILVVRNIKMAETFNNVTNEGLNLIEIDEWNTLITDTNQLKSERALIIYDARYEDSIEVYNNVKYVLDTVGVEVIAKTIDELEIYSNIHKYDNIVICIDDLEDLVYTKYEMEDWVRNGKGLLFTLPLQNNSKLLEFADLLGIKNKNNISVVDFKHMMILDDFLINGKEEVFGKNVIDGIGLKLELVDNIRLHIATDDNDNYPIVWNLQYGNGYVSVCNTNFLHNKDYRGIIISLYAELQDYFVYPVINASMYAIDDFPSPIPSGYNKKIYEDYNYNMENFYFNVWWPRMKQLHYKYGIKYSGYLIQTYEDKVKPPFNNMSYLESAKYYANSLLSIGGELGLHGYNHQSLFLIDDEDKADDLGYTPWNSLNDIFEATRSALAYGKILAPNTKITSYVAPSNRISSRVKSALETEIKDIRIYAGVYTNDETNGLMVQEFEVKSNGIIEVPRTSSGMDIFTDDQYRFLLLGQLSYQYLQFNFIHPDDVTDIDRGALNGFEYLYNQYEKLIKTLNKLSIRNTTVTKGAAAIQRYQLSSFKRYDEYDKINLEVDGIYDEVYYMLRINNYLPVKSVKGASIQKINDTYYLLKITEKNVSIGLDISI